jgi:hypothetical protein
LEGDFQSFMYASGRTVVAKYRWSNYLHSGGKFSRCGMEQAPTSYIELDVRSCDILSIKFQEVQADSMALIAESDG